MISKEEVVKIARLARLELSEKEIEKMQKDMSAILDYFEVLKKAPKSGFASADKDFKNELRADEVYERAEGLAGKLVESAPEKKDGYIKVKQIF